MKKLLVASLSMVMLWISTAFASWIPVSYMNSATNECAASNKYYNYYLEWSTTLYPYDRFYDNTNDVKIDTGASLIRIWKWTGVITDCDGWYLLSNVVPSKTALPWWAYLWEGPCTFNIPNYKKTNNSGMVDAQINYKVWYNNKNNVWWTSVSWKFFYQDFTNDVLRCYPSGIQTSSTNSCSGTNFRYGSLKIHTWECLNFRVFWCGDGLVNSPYSQNGTTYTNAWNFYEECDPQDPSHTNWWANGCTNTCQRDDTPVVQDPVCGNGVLETWEQCEISISFGNNDKLWWNNRWTLDGLQQVWWLDPNMWCDQNCQLKEVSCNLRSTPIEQLVGQSISFSATKDNWADYISLNFWDNSTPIQNPVFPVNHVYSVIWDFQPELMVRNNYTGIIREWVQIPTATCIANANDIWWNNTWVSIISGCMVSLSSESIELGENFSVNYTIWWNFLSPVQMVSLPQIWNNVIINKNWKLTTWTIEYDWNLIESTWTYMFSISWTLSNDTHTPFSCQAELNVLDKKVIWLDLRKELDYISGDIVHYTITLTNTWNGVANNVYIKDIVPSAVVYLTSSIAWISTKKQWYQFYTWMEWWSMIFVYTWLTLNPGQTVTVSFTWQIDLGKVGNGIAKEVAKNLCSDWVQLQVDRTFDAAYLNETQNCAETSGWDITICATMPEPMLLKQQRIDSNQFTSDLIFVELWDMILYRVDFWNESSGDVYGVKLVDVMPKCIQYIDSSINGVQWAVFNAENLEYTFNLLWWQAWYLILTWKIKTDWDCANQYLYRNDVYLYFPNKSISDHVIAKIANDDGRSLKKKANKWKVKEWEDLIYTIMYRNTWDKARDAWYTLIDSWPVENLTFVKDSCGEWCQKEIEWSNYKYTMNDWLWAWASAEMTMEWKVEQCPESWLLVNKVRLKYKVDGVAWETEWVSVVICGEWDDWWTVKKDADKSIVDDWEEITYIITYRNTGDKVRESYRIEDEWPEELEYKMDSCGEWCQKTKNGNVYKYEMLNELWAWEWWRILLTWEVKWWGCEVEWSTIINKVRLIYKVVVNWEEVEWETTWQVVITCGDDDWWTMRKRADRRNVKEWEKVTYSIYYRNTGDKAWEPGYEIVDKWPNKQLNYKWSTCKWICEEDKDWDNNPRFKMNERLESGEWRELMLTWEVGEWMCEDNWWIIVNKVKLRYRIWETWNEVEWTAVITCGDDDWWTMRKRADRRNVKEWEKVTYSVYYRNTGDKAWEPWYILTDYWPEKVNYQWSTCNGVCEETIVTKDKEYKYTVNERLEWWEGRQIVLTWMVDQCPEQWMVVNKVTLKYKVDGTEWTIDGYSVVICGEWDDWWTVKKEADPHIVNNWDKVTYKISYRNTWDQVRENYRLEDEWPNQYLTYISDSCKKWCEMKPNKNIYTYNMNEKLLPWGTWLLYLTWEVDSWVCESIDWGIVNKVKLIYTTIVNWTPVEWIVTWEVKIECGDNPTPPNPIDENKEWWWVEKISDTDKVTSGDTITYTIRYANTWEHAWESYRLEDIWPQSLECQWNCPWTDEMKYKLEFNRPEWLGVWEDGELILTWKVNQCPDDGNIVNEVNLYYTIMEWTHEYTWAILWATKTVECGSWGWEEPSDAYNLPSCLWIDTTISLMRWELLPVRWRMMPVDGTGNEIEYVRDIEFVKEWECDPSDSKTQIKRETVWCTFELYDGNKHNQYDDASPVTSFRLPCFDDKNIDNPSLSWEEIFETFSNEKWLDTWNVDFSKVDWRTGFKVNDLLVDFDNTYGEYKLVLKDIEWEYCSNEWTWKPTIKHKWVCEVDFVLTEPYLMQINTVWALLSTTASFLNSFYTISKDVVITDDIAKKIKVWNVWESTKDISKYVEKFYNKYKSLVINYNGASSRWATSLKKAPSQQIYFVKASSGAIINVPLTWNKPFTVFVEWTGVSIVVSGSMKANWMIINPNWIIEFKDNCTSQWQVVRWIFIAKKFDTDSHMKNTQMNHPWCLWWNLDVKWVLIWNWIDTLIWNRRSNLNDWTNTTTSTENSRRNQIFKWASLLIEYNTELWSQLPPGAEVFTQVLDVLKK